MKSIYLSSAFYFSPGFYKPKRRLPVVVDLTGKDTVDHKAVIRGLREISKLTPGANLEVVLYGQSMDMVLKNKSAVVD